MRGEAASWDDGAATIAPPIVDEDKWHVALSPGEVKVVSLEQLDDLFRLSIVDAETKVWQNGMSEWQPLRVIANLDDAPTPALEAQRTHPKPPTPRSGPPPPRPQSVAPAAPSVRPAPPAPRPQSVVPAAPSVRPAPPAPRPQSVAPAAPSVRPAPPATRPQSVAPAAVFAAPLGLAATKPAFSAPVIAVQPIANVRPLVVSARPRDDQGGAGFGRFLIGLSLLAGLGISLYRNGVVHDAAQSLHQEALFARLESALGGPAFGTQRAVEQSSAVRLGSILNSDLSASLAADPPVTPGVAQAQREAGPIGTQQDTGNGATQTPVVSLESLKPEKSSAARPNAETPNAGSPAPKPAAQPDFGATPRAKAGPTKPVLEKLAPSKPVSDMTERERLNAAIGQSMFAAPSKAKSKGTKASASEYDPLNPKL